MMRPMSEYKFVTLLESDLPKVVLSGMASSKTTFTIHMHGPVSGRELRNVMRYLEMHAEFLDEGDEVARAALSPSCGNESMGEK